MPGFSVGGIQSGLDSNTIIAQLVELKRRAIVTPYTTRKSNLEVRQSAASTLEAAFKKLRDAARKLDGAGELADDAFTATSSKESVVTVSVSDATQLAVSSFDITNITQLARAHSRVAQGVADQDTTAFGTGSFDITVDGITTQVTIDSSNNTLEGIKAAINAADAGVTASIIQDGSANPYRLVLTSKESGTDNSITTDLYSVLSLTEDTASETTAANALFEVNGISIVSQKNLVSDAIAGVTLDLKLTESTDTIKVEIKQDSAEIESRITSFIDSFNELQKALNKEIDANGSLSREFILRDADNQLATILTKTLSGLTSTSDSLVDIGISRESDGTFTIDSEKLSDKIESNLTDVQELFTGVTGAPDDGIADDVEELADNLITSGGFFSTLDQSLTSRILEMDRLIVRQETQLDTYEALQKATFARLENTLSELNSRQSAFTGFFNTSQGGNLLV